MKRFLRLPPFFLSFCLCLALLGLHAHAATFFPLTEAILTTPPFSEYVSSTSANHFGYSSTTNEICLANNGPSSAAWKPHQPNPQHDYYNGYILEGTFDIYVFGKNDSGEIYLKRSQKGFSSGVWASEYASFGAVQVKEYTLTIEYVYADGTTASPAKTYTIGQGKSYSYPSPSILGYTPDKAAVSGTMTADTKVRVTYTAGTYTLTIQYKYTDGTTASATKTYQHKYNERYAYPSPAISGYEASPASVTGTMPAGNTTVTVTYQKAQYTLTIQYIYEDGSKVMDSAVYTLASGTSYSYPSPEVRGHAPDVETVSGTMPSSDKIVTVTYSRQPCQLTILYVYEDGTQAAPTKTVNVTYGTSYSYVSPKVSGYVPDWPFVSGLMLDEPQTVKVTYYKAKKSLTINYILENDRLAFPSRVYQHAAGDVYSYPSPGLAGYTPSIRIVEGTMLDSDRVVNVVYRANSQNLTVQYVYEDGKQAFRSVNGSYTTGQWYSIKSPRKSGYYPDISVVQGNMPTHGITVIVTYYKIETGPYPDVGEEGPDNGSGSGGTGSGGSSSSGGDSSGTGPGGSGSSGTGSSGTGPGGTGPGGSGTGGGTICPDCGCNTSHCHCANNPDCPCGGNCRPGWHPPNVIPDSTIPPGGYLPDGWEMDFGIGEPEDEIKEPNVDFNFWNPDEHADGALQFQDTRPLPEISLPDSAKVKAGAVPSEADPLDPEQYGYTDGADRDLYYYLEKYFGIDGRKE